MPQHINHEGQEPEHGDRGEVLSDALEKAQDFSEQWGSEDDDKAAHCAACHRNAQKSQQFAKAAMVFSLGAFVISIASFALPFLKPMDAVLNSNQMDALMTVLREGVKGSIPSQLNARPQARSSSAVQSSVRLSPKSSAAASSVATAESSASASSAEASSASSQDAAAGTADAAQPSASGMR